MSITVVRDYIQFKDNESFEEVVNRRLPLADDETKREVTGVILSLVRQTTMLQLAKDEHTRSFKHLTELHKFAEESKQDVRDQAQRSDLALKRLNEETASEFDAVKRAADSLENRLEEGEGRRKAIGKERAVLAHPDFRPIVHPSPTTRQRVQVDSHTSTSQHAAKH